MALVQGCGGRGVKGSFQLILNELVEVGPLDPDHRTCYALTGRSSRWEVSWSGVGSGLVALATCDADAW